MTLHFNKSSEKAKRRQLRHDQTYAEEIVWMYLRNRRTMDVKFRRQYSVDNYVIDFYCPKLKLAVEVDGEIHDLPEQKEHDIIRQTYLEGYGIKFIRIKNEELFDNPNKALGKIEAEIERIEKEVDKIVKK